MGASGTQVSDLFLAALLDAAGCDGALATSLLGHFFASLLV